MAGDMHRDDKTEQVSIVIVQYLPLYIKANLEGKNNGIKICILINKKQTEIFVSHQEIFVSHQVYL